jgi:zinc protease
VLEGDESGVRIFRSAGGVPILVQKRPGAIAQLGWFVRGGATDEPPLDLGLTTMMTRASLKGTERRSAQRIAEDSEFLGGVLSAAASADGFQWTMSVPARRIHDAVELLADVVQRPSFTDEAVDSERAVALADLSSLRDDMYRWPMRLATEAAWGAHPYGRSVLGTESSLAAMTAGNQRQWHENVALEAPSASAMSIPMKSRASARDSSVVSRRRRSPRSTRRNGRASSSSAPTLATRRRARSRCSSKDRRAPTTTDLPPR